MSRYNPKEVEKEILEFWDKKKIYKKAKSRNKKGKKFYFLDGPPYTSGSVHIGTAWNKALKDILLRYKRMQGFNVWDRAGYDMHGLPTENAAEKELGLKNKKGIGDFGVGNFVEACRKLSLNNLEKMNKDFKRIGVWMDLDNSYKSITNEFMEGVWWLIKKAHMKKRLYEGEKTMHWCATCATALAKHELEYEKLVDDSIYVKFPVVGSKDEFLIIFTTTPWTIPFNLGIMVHPDFKYAKVKVGKEKWIVAKELVDSLEEKTGKKFEVVMEVIKGRDLEGIKYNHPFEKYFDYSELKKNKKVHSIVLSEDYVNLDGGTGLVHMAPGCGQEDYEVGHRENIPPFNNLDEYGIFPKETKKFAGLKAKKDDDKFIEILDKDGFIVTKEKIEHEYPTCWRCKKPVIFKTTKQWFFKIEDLRENMRELNKMIKWVPDWAGSRQFDAWLDNLRDNGITRQRYWGTPFPVWKCKKCKDYVVVGSMQELKKFGGEVPKDLHIPHIDKVRLKCKCGHEKKRIPDILDVWVDAGSVSWNCLGFPQEKGLLKKYYPADFILEGKDQIRGWFNLLFINSMIAFENNSYKSVYMHGFVQDAKGRKMSKSLGNYIPPEEIIKEYGADTLRYYMVGGASPGLDINYNFNDIKVKHKNLGILWNLHYYLITQSNFLKANPFNIKSPGLKVEEKYMVSFLNSKIKEITKLFEDYRLNDIPDRVEEIFLELSRTYIQMIRDKVSMGSKKEKKAVLYVLAKVLFNSLIMFSTVSPFISEKIYQNLKNEYGLKEESINFYGWPKTDRKKIDKELENNFELAKKIISEVLSKREKTKLGIRWPLKKVEIAVENPNTLKDLEEIIKVQTNVKSVYIKKGKTNIKVDMGMTPELESEGFAREITRKIQSSRKKVGLKKENVIELYIFSQIDLKKFEKEIMEKVGAKKLWFEKGKKQYSNSFKVRGKEIEIGFDVV